MARPLSNRGDVTVVTWNIHGSVRPDLDAVGERLRAFDADVVALQEVQRRQACTLTQILGCTTEYWSFKHWPFPNPFEGHAVLSRHRLTDAQTVTLSKAAPPWSYRRRIAQLCMLDIGGQTLRLANCHLASEDGNERVAQAERLRARLQPRALVVGDLNARPRREALRVLLDAGLLDAWAEANPNADRADGATNWRPSDPDDSPANRIDYILVPEGYRVVTATVPSAADSDLSAYRRLSDHLPVRAVLEQRDSQ
jgi:endonuclease/exonuclease/phosphatase family metal-dependent hydrolase